MSQRAGSRARGYLSRGALLSLLLHVHLLAPIGVVIWIFAGRQQAAREAQRAQEIDVEFQDATAAELPKDLPPIEPPPDQLRAAQASAAEAEGRSRTRRSRRRRRSRSRKDEAREEDRAAAARAEAAGAAAAAARALQKAHEKIVDQETEKKVEPPPDAKYLAQNNHRAAKETRARDTNAREAQKSETAEDNRARPPARQGQDRGARGPEVGAGSQGARRHAAREPAGRRRRTNGSDAPKSLLALRDPAPRNARADARDRRSFAARRPPTATSRCRAPRRGAPADPARVKAGDKVKLALCAEGLRVPVRRRRRGGAPPGADAAVDATGEVRSSKVARVQAALENFVPEVKPGNTDGAEHARGAVRRIHRAHAPEHSQAVGLRCSWRTGTSCRGRARSTTPSWRRRWRWCSTATGRSTRSRSCAPPGTWRFDAAAIDVALHRRAVSRSAARDPLARRQDLRSLDTSTATNASARPRSRDYFILAEKPHRGRRAASSTGPSPHAMAVAPRAMRPVRRARRRGDAPGRAAPSRPPRPTRRARRDARSRRRRSRRRRSRRRRAVRGRGA